MPNLILTPRAEKDLEEIYIYTNVTWGIEQADRCQDELFHGMKLLCEDFEIGMKYPYSNFDYRILHINRYLIFYRIEDKDCVVIRILHDKMNLRERI